MRLSYVLVGLAVVALGTALGLAVWQEMPLKYLFLNMFPVPRLMVLLIVLQAMATVAVAAAHLGSKQRVRRSGALTALAIAPAAAGLLGGGYSALMTWKAVVATHTTNFAVFAPSVAEAAFALGFGLAVGALAALANDAPLTRPAQEAAA